MIPGPSLLSSFLPKNRGFLHIVLEPDPLTHWTAQLWQPIRSSHEDGSCTSRWIQTHTCTKQIPFKVSNWDNIIFRVLQVTVIHRMNHMWENMHTHAHSRTDTQTCRVADSWCPMGQNVSGSQHHPLPLPPLFPWRLNLQCFERWGEKSLSLHMNTHTQSGWPKAKREQVKAQRQDISEYKVHVVCRFCMADCGTCWRCAFRVRGQHWKDSYVSRWVSINQASVRSVATRVMCLQVWTCVLTPKHCRCKVSF